MSDTAWNRRTRKNSGRKHMQYMVKKYKESILVEAGSLQAALGIEDETTPVISVVGAGGKTTIIRKLAEEYKKAGVPVIVTTTTHMRREDTPWLLLEPSMEKFHGILAGEGMVWVGLPDKNGKMKAPSDEFLHRVLELGYPVLIEADGARMLPLKVPAEHEPVIIPETTHVVNVYGLDAIGKPFEEVCFRPELAAFALGKQVTDNVSVEDIIKLALDDKCGKKCSAVSMKYHVVLNKADDEELEQKAQILCGLAEEQSFKNMIVTARGRQKEE